MSFPWVFAHMKLPWLDHGISMVYTPWYYHGKPDPRIFWQNFEHCGIRFSCLGGGVHSSLELLTPGSPGVFQLCL